MAPNPRCLTLIIPLILLLGCADASQDGASPPVCSKRSLQGTYLYQIIGRDAVPEGQVTAGPYAEAGMDLYDGNGQVTLPYRARLTPMATDWIKSRRIQIGLRLKAPSMARSTAASERPCWRMRSASPSPVVFPTRTPTTLASS